MDQQLELEVLTKYTRDLLYLLQIHRCLETMDEDRLRRLEEALSASCAACVRTRGQPSRTRPSTRPGCSCGRSGNGSCREALTDTLGDHHAYRTIPLSGAEGR